MNKIYILTFALLITIISGLVLVNKADKDIPGIEATSPVFQENIVKRNECQAIEGRRICITTTGPEGSYWETNDSALITVDEKVVFRIDGYGPTFWKINNGIVYFIQSGYESNGPGELTYLNTKTMATSTIEKITIYGSLSPDGDYFVTNGPGTQTVVEYCNAPVLHANQIEGNAIKLLNLKTAKVDTLVESKNTVFTDFKWNGDKSFSYKESGVANCELTNSVIKNYNLKF